MKSNIFATVLFLLLSMTLRAQIENIVDFESAVIAEIESISEVPDGATITINIKSVVVGSTASGIRDFKITNHPLTEFDRYISGMHVLVLIKKSADGEEALYVHPTGTDLIPLTFIPLPKTIGYEEWSPNAQLSGLDDLTRFLTWVIERDQSAGLAYGFLSRLMQRRVENISPQVSDYIWQLTKRTDNQKLFSLTVAALVEAQDIRAFEEILKAVVDRRWDLVNDPRIAHSLRLIDPRRSDHIPFLLRLLEAEAPIFRREVAIALAANHSIATVSTLAKLLDDDDPEIVAYAVGGLAMFANGVPPGGIEPTAAVAPYRTEETIAHSVMSTDAVATRRSYYVDFWRSWWQQHGSRILEASR